MNLYWVNNAIYKLYDEFVDPETGEITDPDAFAERYAKLNISRDEVIENILLLYKNCVSDAAAIDEEIKSLKARKQALDKRAERLKTDASQALGGEKFSTAKVSVTWRKSTAVEVDGDTVPDEYMTVKVERSPDKKAITAALKAGTPIDGCRLVERMNMQIK